MSNSLCLRLACAVLFVLPAANASAQVRARIIGAVDDTQLHRLTKNTHPLARGEFDRGAAPDTLALHRMQLVLTRSAAQDAALGAFLASQQDPHSPNFHRWLTPEQFGAQFGAADSDVQSVTSWLQSHGFQISHLAKGRNLIEFSGTAGQVRNAFHTEIHRYVVNGISHWANSSDPEIPVALAPVIAGVSSLHNFRKAPQIAGLRTQLAKRSASGLPLFTGSDGTHALAPADFYRIYNMTEAVLQGGAGGHGATIAVVARTNINQQDITAFRNSFGLPANNVQVVINQIDPGDIGGGDEAEAVLDTSWSGAIAPGATVKLVVSASTETTDGVDLSEAYIIDQNLADVMTESYGDCEANYTAAEAQAYASLAEQAAAQGISYTVASGDSGAAGCDDPGSEVVATGPVSVNVLSSTPYNIAVGGTQFNENGKDSTYWSSRNGSTLSSVLSYIPEVAWNESCTVQACGADSAGIWAGSGGASAIFSKPSWQSGVVGIPNDGARDVPDVSFTSAGHDFYLLCLDGSCTAQRGQDYFAGVSGTSAATPSFAGVMALIVEQTGTRQGLPNAVLYKIAGTETLGSCNASNASAPPAASCVFNDVTVGNNAVPGQSGYGSGSAAYQAGVGYDLATGLGSINVANLLAVWTTSGGATAPQVRVFIDSPSSLNSTVSGTAAFSGWALADLGSIASLAISIDSEPAGKAIYGLPRPDVCVVYPARTGCPTVGWSYSFDSARLANGPHVLGVTAATSDGQVYTASSSFTVANWSTKNPMSILIDTPNASSGPLSGMVHAGGWAIDSSSAIAGISVAVDGTPASSAYGGSRPDVCKAHAGAAGCPNVGWDASINTASLSEGLHTLTVTGTSAGGQRSTVSTSFAVANFPANPMKLNIDTPGSQGGTFSGSVGFGGWAISTATPIASIVVSVDGLVAGTAGYGTARPDVCKAYPNRSGCPNVGWNFLLDTTQLANGLHLLQVAASTGDGESVMQTATFTVANTASLNPVLLSIEQPNLQNAIVTSQANLTGSVIARNDAILNEVRLSVDGTNWGSAIIGSAQPVACPAPLTGSCTQTFWSLLLDTNTLGNGTHVLSASAVATEAGAPQNGSLSAGFTVANWTDANPMKITIDRPNAQMGALTGQLGIGGWAIDQFDFLTSISLAVDNVSMGAAGYGGSRPDVCASRPGVPGCPNVGWNATLDTTQYADGSHTLAVTGTTANGRSSTFTTTFQVQNAGSVPVKTTIDRPSLNQVLSATASIGGWALDTDGQVITQVQILVDGIAAGSAGLGSERPDVCAHYSTAGGCPNVGWNYQLDTTPFANGTHNLEARAVSADGHTFTASVTFKITNQP